MNRLRLLISSRQFQAFDITPSLHFVGGEFEDWKGRGEDLVKINSLNCTLTPSEETASTIQISRSAYLAAGYYSLAT